MNTATTTAPETALQTPSDGEAPAQPMKLNKDGTPKKKRSPRRFQLFDDGGGDFRIYEVIPAGHKTLPAGSLVPIPEFGGYPDAVTAKKALRTKGDHLQGKTVIVIRGVEIVRITVETRPSIRIESKPRKQVSGPVIDEAKA